MGYKNIQLELIVGCCYFEYTQTKGLIMKTELGIIKNEGDRSMKYQVNFEKTFTSGIFEGMTSNESLTVYSMDAVYDWLEQSGGMIETIPCAGKSRYVLNNVTFEEIR